VAYLLADGGHWRWMFASQMVPVFWLIAGLIFVPESPRWLAMMGRFADALKVLAKINGQTQAEKDLNEIRAEVGDEEGDFSELFRPGVRKALIIGIVLMVFSQTCGATIIHLYAPTLFLDAQSTQEKSVATLEKNEAVEKKSDTTKETDAIRNGIYICIWASLCTMSSFLVVRAFGRRPILIFGSIAMAAGHLMLVFCFQFHASNLLTLGAMMFTSASFVLTLAPLSWVVLAEIFPNRVRGKAMSIATVTMFTSSYVAIQIFKPTMEWFRAQYGHPGGTFLIFLVICLLCALFVWRMLPETKDKTLEQIGESWLNYGNDRTTK
jgi:SP family arabinose:H+ symporter-like MFS transporter